MSTTDSMDAFEAWAEENAVDIYDEVPRDAWKAALAWQAATEAAKATGTEDIYLGEDLPPLPESIEVGGEGWDWEDFQSEKTFSVQHMLHYGAACAQAAFADAARQPAPVAQKVEELLQYIADHDWGGIPEPVNMIADLRAALAATAAPVLSDEQIQKMWQESREDTLKVIAQETGQEWVVTESVNKRQPIVFARAILARSQP